MNESTKLTKFSKEKKSYTNEEEEESKQKKKTIYILNETTKNDHEFQGFNITQTL